MKKIYWIPIALVSLFSCKGNFIDGKYPDTIKMERTELNFGAKNDTVTFKTEGNYYKLNPNMSNWDKTHKHTYVNTSYETLHDTVYYDEWVKIIALKDEYKVKVIVFDNETGAERVYRASLQDKGFYGYLKVIQNAK